MWKPVDEIVARWRPVEGEGLEHLVLKATPEGYSVASRVIGESDTGAFAVSYAIDLDKGWRVRAFTVDAVDGRRRSYRSIAEGRWQDGAGRPLAAFDGCIDIDLSFTCFTNSLPVRRTSFGQGQAREFAMLWMPSDTLDPFVDGQRYACLEPGRRFHYAATDGSIEATIEFDDYGLVTDYPGLFRRVA
ncbi:MAG: putative glycolipid-binding domain-containing protein [Parvibaculaceae bacterium]